MSDHDGFPNWNGAPGGGWYKDVDISVNGVPGVEHVYENGHSEFVANPAPVTVVSSTPQPTTPSPAPVAPAPAPTAGPTGGTPAPAPAPAPAPSPAPNPVSSTPQPTTGGSPNIPPAPAWNPSDPTVYENPTTHDVYQVDDASANGQWHVYQTHAEWVAAPPGESGWDITNVTPAQYAAEQAGNPPPTTVGSTPQPATGSGGSPPTAGVTGGTPAPSDPSTSTPTVVSSTAQPSTSGSPTYGSTGGTAAPTDSSGTSGDTGGTPAPVAEGASYTVVHGDTMWGISQSNNISLSQLEALNPQIKDPDLIFPGQSVNLGSGGSTDPTSSSVASPPSSATGGTAASSPIQANTPPVSAGSGASQSIGSSSDSGASNTIGFPGKSSYPSIGSEVDKVADDIESAAKAQGWGSGSDNGTSDIAKGPFETDSHTSTDPLKIEDKK